METKYYTHLIYINTTIIMDIKEICKKYKITNYEINEDNTIDVYGNVDLWDKKLKEIPLNFNKVTGNFSCSYNNLTSLEGCPKWVGGDFSCHYNKLLDIDCGIQMVDGNFYCQNNKITTLKGSPKSVGSFFCYKNKITNLKGCPKYITDDFDCRYNILKTNVSNIKSVRFFLTTLKSEGLNRDNYKDWNKLQKRKLFLKKIIK